MAMKNVEGISLANQGEGGSQSLLKTIATRKGLVKTIYFTLPLTKCLHSSTLVFHTYKTFSIMFTLVFFHSLTLLQSLRSTKDFNSRSIQSER